MSNGEFFNSLDYIYIFITLISCIVGFFRGFTKDFLSSCAWFGSGFISAFIAPYLTIYLQEKFIQNPLLAKVISITVAYLVVLITFLLIINTLSVKIKSTMLSSLDRALGCLFGLVRGGIILLTIVIFGIFFEALDNKSDLIKNSKITPPLILITSYLMPKIIDSSSLSDSIKSELKSTMEEKEKSLQFTKKKAVSKKETEREKKVSYLREARDYINNAFSSYLHRYDNNLGRQQHLIKRRKNKDVEFGCMSLMRARAERRMQKKADKLVSDLEKRLDKASQ